MFTSAKSRFTYTKCGVRQLIRKPVFYDCTFVLQTLIKNTMKNQNQQLRISVKTAFTFKNEGRNQSAKSTEHPTLGGTTNTTYIFNCKK